MPTPSQIRKFLPVYPLFYHLPIVGFIRNPDKFLQVMQLGIGILAAYGLDGVLRQASGEQSVFSPERRRAFLIWLGVGIACFLYWIFRDFLELGALAKNHSDSPGFPLEATILQNKILALLHGGGFLLALLLLSTFGLFHRWGQASGRRTGVVWFLLLAVAIDAYAFSRPFVQTMEAEPIQTNPVAAYLSTSVVNNRYALASREGFYNHWLTYDFPYHELTPFNLTSAPRIKIQEDTLVRAVPTRPRLWELAGVSHVLVPWALGKRLESAYAYEPVMGFTVEESATYPYQVEMTRDFATADHLIYEIPQSNRVSLFGTWEMVEEKTLLDRLNLPLSQKRDRVLIPDTVELPPPNPSA
jgi:hypothetical protein